MQRCSIALAVLVLGSALAMFRSSAIAQQATPEIALERGIAYGEADGQPLLLDVYRPPAGSGSHPAVILLPGWESTRSSVTGPALALAEAGYVAFAVDYRLHWPEHIDDAQLAVRWVRPIQIGMGSIPSGSARTACPLAANLPPCSACGRPESIPTRRWLSTPAGSPAPSPWRASTT